jgi:beta-alanine degradation protein BauB
MKYMFAAASLILLLNSRLIAQDPAKTDSDKYSVVLENERVRVLEYRDKPGDRTTMHHHPDFVLYALSPFKRKLTFPDGKVLVRQFKTGDVIYMDEQKHIGENIGETDTHVVIVELKGSAKQRKEKAGAKK